MLTRIASSDAAIGAAIDGKGLNEFLGEVVQQFVSPQPLKRILLLPPDHTRLASQAGLITAWLYDQLSPSIAVDVMPALGTHSRMTADQFGMMFGDSIPYEKMVTHNWREDIVTAGHVNAEEMSELSNGRFCQGMDVEINRRIVDGSYDLILSIGQVVPHEVIGFANYSKNVCVGAGGKDVIHKSHFLGAVCDMETVMGNVNNPVRQLIDQAFSRFVTPVANVVFVLTVVAETDAGAELRGLFASSQRDAFVAAAELSSRVNVRCLETPIDRCVTYLDPREFKSTWLGNKAIYRTRMAMADGGQLTVLAPAVETFGEDPDIDRMIRRFGYRGSPQTLAAVKAEDQLARNLAAAAHLIHGSSEGRFRITYCPSASLSRTDIEGVGYQYQPLEEALRQLPDQPQRMSEGWHQDHRGEPFYFIKNPALGLWTRAGGQRLMSNV